MKRILFIITFLLFTTGSFAHGSDASTMVFVEQEDHTWTIQIRSSLDAFRKEIRKHYTKTPYKTPEQFKSQVLEYIGKTLHISVNNNQQKIAIENGFVKLGHETIVFFKDIKLPKNYNSINIEAKIFKDIFRSKLKLFILREGLEKKQLILNKKNDYTTSISLNKIGSFISKEEITTLSLVGIIVIFTLLIITFISCVFLKRMAFFESKFNY